MRLTFFVSVRRRKQNHSGRTAPPLFCTAKLKDRAAELQGELSKAQEATVNAEKFMNIVRKYTRFEELTPTLLREFIEKS